MVYNLFLFSNLCFLENKINHFLIFLVHDSLNFENFNIIFDFEFLSTKMQKKLARASMVTFPFQGFVLY